MTKCNLCPRNCNVDRALGELGFCKASENMKIAKYCLHHWEEPPISGKNGSGTIFFSYCNLQCVFCQNYDISTNHLGYEISIDDFVSICLELQKNDANNINLVTPTHYINQIKEGLIKAKKQGLTIPIVYNTSSYENVEALKELNGLIDIYLADLKYFNDQYARRYSTCFNYFKYATLAIEEMYKQVGKPRFNKRGLMEKGLIVRHLMLPELLEDSKKIINYLYDKYHDNIYISIMNQYTPLKYVESIPELNKKVSVDDYDELVDYAYDLGIRNAFIQEGETQKESFIPDFK